MAIKSFSGRYDFLSNFHECSITYNGIAYKHSEGAFQAQKTLNDDERYELSMLPAGKVKRAGRKVTLRADWEEVKDDEMYKIVLTKFTQNIGLRAMLLATGNEELIEGNYWHDNYWGDCSCERCKNKPGQNKLGKILMRVREELRSE